MSTELQTNVTASELIEGAPAVALALGKTITEKRLAVVKQTTDLATMLVAMSLKGKIATAAREMAAEVPAPMLARRVLSGNYKAVAESLALILGESVSFGSAAEAPKGETPEQFRARQREDWDLWGKLTRKEMEKLPATNKAGKTSPKYARFMEAMNLYTEVRAHITAEMVRREEARKAKEAAPAAA